jgi:gamma-glutamylcyclotransferase (GGCT)/AIG2-like uncharacterized protein YtfP
VAHVQLFAYGELMTRQGRWKAAARGDLRKRGKDCAARFDSVYKYAGIVYGQVQVISGEEFQKLAKLEAPEYKARWIRLTDGRVCAAFQYIKPDFESLPEIKSGKFRGPDEGA